MQQGTRQGDQDGDRYSLQAADAIARAAHLWIRSLYNRFEADEFERQAVAGGLVAGLCERLDLDPTVTDLVAYVYALLDDQGIQALPVSRFMLENPRSPHHRSAYRKGKKEAAEIVEMVAFYRRH
jgi:phage shock protein PspC (stress-responsive transcriptional regulator)